jgi:hypothetical protein
MSINNKFNLLDVFIADPQFTVAQNVYSCYITQES